MPQSYDIRTVRRSDMAALVDLCAAHARYERAPYHQDGKAARLRELLFERTARLFGFVVDGPDGLVGYATYTVQWSTWDAASYLYMDCLYLDADVRGRGIGERLVQRIIAEARTRECQAVEWQTPIFNTRAMTFYDRLGADGTEKVRYRLAVDSHA